MVQALEPQVLALPSTVTYCSVIYYHYSQMGYQFDLTSIADCTQNDLQLSSDELSVLVEKLPSPVIEDEAAVFDLSSSRRAANVQKY